MENSIIQPTFRDWLKEAVDQGKTATYRADPILASTDTTLVQKQVAGLDILTSPGEAFLRQLGVTFYPGLVGNFVVPSLAEDTGQFVTEGVSDASSANMATSSITLAARRISHTQAISKETLAQTSPGIYNGIVQNLVNGLWNCVTNDLFDQVRIDCTSTNDKTIKYGAAGIYSALVGMEASIGGKLMSNPAYVFTPTMRAGLATTASLTNQGPIYENGKVNSYPAYGVPAQNTGVISFGDWSKTCVGQWGPIEIIVDPYTSAKTGLINLTIVGLFDTGCFNKLGMVNWIDGSVA